jgi:hypothetical protein
MATRLPAHRHSGVAPRFVRTHEAAAFLNLSGRTLEKHRCTGTGPVFPQARRQSAEQRRTFTPQSTYVRNLSPTVQTFCDDLGRLRRRLAQARIFDDLALYTFALVLQLVAQHLELADEPLDFLH